MGQGFFVFLLVYADCALCPICDLPTPSPAVLDDLGTPGVSVRAGRSPDGPAWMPVNGPRWKAAEARLKQRVAEERTINDLTAGSQFYDLNFQAAAGEDRVGLLVAAGSE